MHVASERRSLFYRVAYLGDRISQIKKFQIKKFHSVLSLKNEQSHPEGHICTPHRSGPCLLLSNPQEKISTLKLRKDHLRLLCFTEPKINRLTVLPTGKIKSYSSIKNLFDKSHIELGIKNLFTMSKNRVSCHLNSEIKKRDYSFTWEQKQVKSEQLLGQSEYGFMY